MRALGITAVLTANGSNVALGGRSRQARNAKMSTKIGPSIKNEGRVWQRMPMPNQAM